MIDAAQDRTYLHTYILQQQVLDNIATKLGVVCFRPNYHAKKGDANTVLFYTKEDHAHNCHVDRQPTTYSPSQAADLPYFIDEKYIYRDHFWFFENTDINGRHDLDFANFGMFDLRGHEWAKRIYGAVWLDLTKKLQKDYVISCGGFAQIFEADERYNDYNRDLIASFAMAKGETWIGSFNLTKEERDDVRNNGMSVYRKYEGDTVLNFGCSFIVPKKDEKLEMAIKAWNGLNEKNTVRPEHLLNLVERAGGIYLHWF